MRAFLQIKALSDADILYDSTQNCALSPTPTQARRGTLPGMLVVDPAYHCGVDSPGKVWGKSSGYSLFPRRAEQSCPWSG